MSKHYGDDLAYIHDVGFGHFRVEEDKSRRELTRTMTTFRRVGKLYRRDHEVHRLRLYKASDVSARLRRVGFRVRTVRHYGKMALPQGMVGFVARKK